MSVVKNLVYLIIEIYLIRAHKIECSYSSLFYSFKTRFKYNHGIKRAGYI